MDRRVVGVTKTLKEEFKMNQDFQDATKSLNQAWQNFDWADSDHIDLAICDIAGAEMRIELALQDARKEVRTNEN